MSFHVSKAQPHPYRVLGGAARRSGAGGPGRGMDGKRGMAGRGGPVGSDGAQQPEPVAGGPANGQGQAVLGGPTFQLTVNMQVRDLAAHWTTAIRLAPGSTDSHAGVMADLAKQAVRELTVYLAEKRIETGGRE